MRQFVEESLQTAVKVGSTRAESLCLHALGAVDYLLGDWSEASGHLASSVDLARQVGSTFGEVLGLQRMAAIETMRGEFETSHKLLSDALSTAQVSQNPMVQVHSMTRIFGGLTSDRLEAGDLQGATEYLAKGLEVQGAVGKCVPCDVLLYPAAVPLYIALGDLEQADWACSQLEDSANRFGSRAWIAQARYLRGLLAGEFQEWKRAKTLLRGAMSIYEELKQPFDLSNTQRALGEVLLRGGTVDGDEDPVALLEAAQRGYESLGALNRRDEVARLLSEMVL